MVVKTVPNGDANRTLMVYDVTAPVGEMLPAADSLFCLCFRRLQDLHGDW